MENQNTPIQDVSGITQKSQAEMVAALVRQLWLLTADRQIGDEELKARAEAWCQVFEKGNLLGKYLPYAIRCCFASRSVRGPVHADEFFRVWMEIRHGKVWSYSDRSWVREQELVVSFYRAVYPEDLVQREPDPSKDVYAEIQKKIYGWE